MNRSALKFKLFELTGKCLRTFGKKTSKPFFIIGTGRCGTTLLVDVLNSQEQLIGFPGEANEYWHPNSYPYLKKKIETGLIIENPEKFTQLSVANWSKKQPKRLKNAFSGFHFIKGNNKKLFTKSAMISYMLPQITQLFPDAKIIHIYRNGPSVIKSLEKKEWHKFTPFFPSVEAFRTCAAQYWNDCLFEIEKQKKQLNLDKNGLFFEFSYEGFCENPALSLEKLSGFLDIDHQKFHYNLENIVSQNYKVGNYTNDESWSKLLKIMEPAMKLKSYL